MKKIIILVLLAASVEANTKGELMKIVKYDFIEWSAKVITGKETNTIKIKRNQDDWLFENNNLICRIFKEVEHPISNLKAQSRTITCAMINEKTIISTEALCDPFAVSCFGNIAIADKDNKNILRILVLGEKRIK